MFFLTALRLYLTSIFKTISRGITRIIDFNISSTWSIFKNKISYIFTLFFRDS